MTDEHDREEQIVAKEVAVDLDLVRQRIMDSQEHVSEILCPLLGWALLTFLLLDMMGNVLGLPVFTASMFCQKEPSQGLVVFAFMLQAMGFAGAGFLLYRSRWRFWVRTMFLQGEDEVWLRGARELVDGKLQSLFTRVTTEGKRLKEQAHKKVKEHLGSEPDEESEAAPEPEVVPEAEAPMRRKKKGRVLKILLGLVLLGGAGVLIYFFPGLILSGVMIGLIGAAVSFLADTALASVQIIYGKIKTNYGSMMGLYAGVGAAAVFMLLFGGGKLLLYPKQAWLYGTYFPFRVLELLLLCGLVLAIKAQQKISFKYFTFYRATKPTGVSPRTYHVFDFMKIAAWPAYLSFDADQLTKIVALGRRPDRHFEVVDHSSRLALMSREYTILNLQALQARIGENPTELSDSCDVFKGKFRYTIMARSFQSLHSSLMGALGNILPERPMAVFLEDIFKSDNPRLLLDRLLKKAVDRYVDVKGKSAQDLREDYTDVLAQARESAMFRAAELQPMAGGSDGAGGLALTLVGYEQLRRIRDTLSGSLQAPRQQWQVFRQRRLKAKQELPQVFRELLRQHFVEAIGSARGEQEERELADETVECLLQCSGIELEVETFDFAPGAAVECEHMVGTIDKEFAEKFTLIEAQVREREAKVLEFFQKRLELADQGKRDLILQLVEKAPAVLPYLLQSPVGERFIRFFLTLGESAVREKLGQLSSVPANDPNLGRMLTEMMASGADRKDGNGAQGGEPSF